MFLYVPSSCKSDATGLCQSAGQRRPVPGDARWCGVGNDVIWEIGEDLVRPIWLHKIESVGSGIQKLQPSLVLPMRFQGVDTVSRPSISKGVAEAWRLPRRVMPCLLAGAFISCLPFCPYSSCPRRAVAAAPSADSQLRDELHVLPARLDWIAEPSLQRALLTAGCGYLGRSLCPSSARLWALSAATLRLAEPDSGVQSWRCWDVEVLQAAPGMMADRGSRGHSLCRSPFHSRVAAAVVPYWAEPGSGVQSERCRDVQCGSRGHSLCRSPFHSRVAAAVAGQRVAVHSAHA